MAGHQDVGELLDLIEGRLPADRRAAVLAALASDPGRRALHASLTALVADPARPVLERPSSEVHAALERLLPTTPRAARLGGLTDAMSRPRAWVSERIATVRRDSYQGPVFAGARAADVGAARDLLFDLGDGAELVLQLTVDRAGVRVSGQVLADEPQRTVTLIGDDGDVVTAADDLGELSATYGPTSFLVVVLDGPDVRCSLDLTPFLDAAPYGTATDASPES